MRLLLVSLALLLLAPSLRAQSFQGLGDLPGSVFISSASAVSADGSVVAGVSYSAGPALEGFRWTESGGMQGLGFLPGYGDSSAGDVSADGNVIVGYGYQDYPQAFRWTAGGGIQGLGSLPDGGDNSIASGTSADGSVIVGQSKVREGFEAFRWTAGGGMQGLGFLPGGDDTIAYGISADGSVIVGQGRVSNGTEAFRWTSSGGMVGLGDLPGGVFFSQAMGASANGSVIVGVGRASDGPEAFRWTASEGMVGLGDLPGGTFASHASDVSDDGSIIVGAATGTDGSEAAIWTETDGWRAVKTILEEDHGLDLTGWTLQGASGVSADGTVIVGSGINPKGQTEAWRAEIAPSLALLGPPADTLLVAGEDYLIRWRRPASVGTVNVLLLPDSLGAPFETLILAFENDSLRWTPPDTFFSRSARLVVQDATNPAVADTSAYFRVRPYHLTRLSADGTRYVPFDVTKHGWPFANDEPSLFPPSWWAQDQFNYFGGRDPFSQLPYDPSFPLAPTNAFPSIFPDWPAYTRAFGTDDAYWVLSPGVSAPYRDSFVATWAAFRNGDAWGGSCSGMAISSLLAFGHREAFGAAYPAIGVVEELHAVGISGGAREAINTLFSYWDGDVQQAYVAAVTPINNSPRGVLATLKERFLSDDRTRDGYLYIADSTGAHAISPYRLERDPADDSRWRLYVYDPNLPDEELAFVAIDSTANTWSYGGFSPAWGGGAGIADIFVMDPVPNYLEEAIFIPGAVPLDRSRIPQGEASIYISATPGASVTLTAMDGSGSIGYAGSATFNTLDGGLPNVPPVGGATPPIGYTVPAGRYSLSLSDAPAERFSATVFGTGSLYSYGRQDAGAGQADRLTVDPGAHDGAGELTVRSEDTGRTTSIALRAIVGGSAMERTLDVRDLTLTDADSVRFASPDDDGSGNGPRLRLQNEGGDKTYTLRLRQAGADAAPEFLAYEVSLVAGATHTVRPAWATLGDDPVEVDVDLDGDGTPDETLVLANQVANEPGGPREDRPRGFVLHAAYPNPFAQRATLRFELEEAGRVHVAVYDLLGREVATLVDGERAAGTHEVVVERGDLAGGVYLVRMSAAGSVQTRRLTLLR